MQRLYGQLYFDDVASQSDLAASIQEDHELIMATADGRVRFEARDEGIVARISSPPDLPVVYPVRETHFSGPAKAVLMDLDGTTILSEEYWISAIEDTVRLLLQDENFAFSEEDLPHVAGYSTREHLEYCLEKYQIDATINDALQLNADVMQERFRELERNPGSPLLKPSPGLREFLLTLKESRVKIGLVTSASERKALLEIRSVFSQIGLGDPLEFYDTIITAGSFGCEKACSTLGSLASKPHPWLYLEAARTGLGFADQDRDRIIGIEDSAAGVISLKLAGFAAIGMKDGNIASSGLRPLLHAECEFLPDLLPILL
ncbi:MAG: HAD family phosphatase [Bacillota bacterium]|nr:HAD family phosphatase [Bacillota bacterium]